MRRKRIDLFAFGIAYNDPTDFGANEDPEPLYNGNISQVQWSTATVNTTGNTVSERYSYGYDALNRITSATDNTGHYNLAGILYDKNGNIGRLERKGHTAVDGTGQVTSFTGSMDDLDYGYFNNGASNRLYKVRDDGSDGYGFKDGTGDTQDYWYDGNGNLTRDLNKGIGTASTDGIEYNHLNLPTKIEMGSEDISYVYDAAGTKIQKTVSTGSSVTDYAGNYIYQGGTLQFISQPEGYVTPDGQGGYDYVYQYKDHLGNIRLSYVDDGNGGLEIVEENNYYPFGLKHKGYNDNGMSSLGNDVAQKWKYQNQELNESFDYNMYEFELRHYDAALGRFVTTDPYEQFHSPYLAMGNNPVLSFDLDGGYCYDANGKKIACPTDSGDLYDDYVDSNENHITILDEAVVTEKSKETLANEAYWKEINASAELLNKIATLETGKTSSGRVDAARAEEELSKVILLNAEPPKPVLIGGGAMDLIGGKAAGTIFIYLARGSKGVKYVGITNNLARRAAEHLKSKGIVIEELMKTATRADAKAVEQVLIEIHKLEKNGGTLINKINSISKKNPAYAKQIERGYELLKSIGYK